MPTVDDLFDRYRASYRAGESADPRPYLDQISGVDRAELGALIDAFLAQDPGRRGTPNALTARISAAVAERLQTQETWTTLLPTARDRAQVPRSAVVKRLAEALGVQGKETKVAAYYHEMESGTLPPAGVSDRVLQALSAIVEVPVERLRAAGRQLSPPATGGGAVFARSTSVAAVPSTDMSFDLDLPERDEVDELFTMG
jgi:hypothetical protein